LPEGKRTFAEVSYGTGRSNFQKPGDKSPGYFRTSLWNFDTRKATELIFDRPRMTDCL